MINLLGALTFAAVMTPPLDAGPLTPIYAKREATVATRGSDWAKAETNWKTVADLNPTDAQAWMELGRSRYQLKKYTEAIEPLRKADALGVSYPWDMPYFVACCEALSGKPDDAMADLEKAINLGFRDLHLAQTDEDLKSLHDRPKFHELVGDEDVSKLSRVEGWRHDLHFYLRELHRLDFGYLHSRDNSIDDVAQKLETELPTLTDNQIQARFMMMGAAAGDGHTHIRPGGMSPAQLPIQVIDFPEGMFIVAASPVHKELLGSRITAINGHPIAEVFEKCVPLAGHENSQWPRVQVPQMIVRPWLLNGLGLSESADEVSLQLDRSGSTTEVKLKGDASGPAGDWSWVRKQAPTVPLTFKRKNELFWYEYLPDSKTVFFQYNAVSDDKDKKLTVAEFAKDLFGFIESHPVDRLILDLRWNGGGNNFLNQPLLLGLIRSKVNEKGKLFVITGPNTFSAAMCFTTQVERYTNAIFAGEPQGSSPNFAGESIPVTLPYSKMSGTISDLYWQNGVAMDHRKWISPQIYVPYTFASYSTGKDPVIDAIMGYRSD